MKLHAFEIRGVISMDDDVDPKQVEEGMRNSLLSTNTTNEGELDNGRVVEYAFEQSEVSINPTPEAE